MKLQVRLSKDDMVSSGVKNADGTDQLVPVPQTVSEANAKNLRVEGGNLAYEVGAKTKTVALRDVLFWTIDGGSRQVIGDNTVDGPLSPDEQRKHHGQPHDFDKEGRPHR